MRSEFLKWSPHVVPVLSYKSFSPLGINTNQLFFPSLPCSPCSNKPVCVNGNVAKVRTLRNKE